MANPDLCGAKNRAGKACRNRAGKGTDHLGVGRCANHCGQTKTGRVAGARAEGASAAIALGASIDVDPLDGLMSVVRFDAGWEAFCRERVTSLGHDDLVVQSVRTRNWGGGEGAGGFEEIASTDATLHIWLNEWRRSKDDLAKHCKMALDAGAQEQAIRVIERFADLIVSALQVALTGHGIEKKDWKPAVIRSAIYAIEGGQQEAEAA